MSNNENFHYLYFKKNGIANFLENESIPPASSKYKNCIFCKIEKSEMKNFASILKNNPNFIKISGSDKIVFAWFEIFKKNNFYQSFYNLQKIIKLYQSNSEKITQEILISLQNSELNKYISFFNYFFNFFVVMPQGASLKILSHYDLLIKKIINSHNLLMQNWSFLNLIKKIKKIINKYLVVTAPKLNSPQKITIEFLSSIAPSSFVFCVFIKNIINLIFQYTPNPKNTFMVITKDFLYNYKNICFDFAQNKYNLFDVKPYLQSTPSVIKKELSFRLPRRNLNIKKEKNMSFQYLSNENIHYFSEIILFILKKHFPNSSYSEIILEKNIEKIKLVISDIFAIFFPKIISCWIVKEPICMKEYFITTFPFINLLKKFFSFNGKSLTNNIYTYQPRIYLFDFFANDKILFLQNTHLNKKNSLAPKNILVAFILKYFLIFVANNYNEIINNAPEFKNVPLFEKKEICSALKKMLFFYMKNNTIDDSFIQKFNCLVYSLGFNCENMKQIALKLKLPNYDSATFTQINKDFIYRLTKGEKIK